jgi:hypothetical protein
MNRFRRLLPSVLLNAAVPLLGYALLRPRVGSDAVALAIAGAVPVAVTVAKFAVRRKVDPIGVVALLAFGVALVVMALSGGNPLVLKLHDAVVTGPLGVVCLVSVAVRRPLHRVVIQLLARRDPRLRLALRNPATRRASMVMTALVGTVLVVHALVLLALALTEPTGTFLALSKPVGWSIIGTGIVAMLWYRNRLRTASHVPHTVQKGE